MSSLIFLVERHKQVKENFLDLFNLTDLKEFEMINIRQEVTLCILCQGTTRFLLASNFEVVSMP